MRTKGNNALSSRSTETTPRYQSKEGMCGKIASKNCLQSVFYALNELYGIFLNQQSANGIFTALIYLFIVYSSVMWDSSWPCQFHFELWIKNLCLPLQFVCRLIRTFVTTTFDCNLFAHKKRAKHNHERKNIESLAEHFGIHFGRASRRSFLSTWAINHKILLFYYYVLCIYFCVNRTNYARGKKTHRSKIDIDLFSLFSSNKPSNIVNNLCTCFCHIRSTIIRLHATHIMNGPLRNDTVSHNFN